ncbi:MAG: ABC transporter ATP-binding protein [Alphaproteobacteria bacterium]
MADSSSSSSVGIDLRGITLGYDGGPLFAGLDFQLMPGQCTCLLGPSGVGKSSLLRVIAGLVPLDGGDIRCTDGRSIKKRIAWMGQSDGLLPWLTVEDNICLGARLRGERPARDRAARLLKDLDIAPLAGRLPATLSGGQRQRAALARTLMEDRPIVLMDEPFSALDAITRSRLQALAAEALAGRTVLLVTHDPLEALRLGHRIHVMTGTPATIEPALCPDGAPPRAVDDRDLLTLQATLLGRLAGAVERAA